MPDRDSCLFGMFIGFAVSIVFVAMPTAASYDNYCEKNAVAVQYLVDKCPKEEKTDYVEHEMYKTLSEFITKYGD